MFCYISVVISRLPNNQSNQETFELKPIIRNNPSNAFNIAPLNVPTYNQDIPDGNGSRNLEQGNITEENLPTHNLSIHSTKLDRYS